MRLPSGYGSVQKMGGHRRKPYMVRKTSGWEYDPAKDKMVQKFQIIGYAKTKAEGLKMLAEFNENPYDASSRLSFSQVYEEWSKHKYPTVSRSNVNGYSACYRACSALYNRPFSSLRLDDLQAVVDSCGKNYPTLKKLKNLFSQLYEYALKHDICPKNYAEFVDISQYKDRNPNKRVRDRIPEDDLEKIWSMKDDPYWQIVLMLIYNGCRVMEFLSLRKEDVNLDEQYFDIRKSKTENGIRRVPIADKVLPFYRSWYDRFPGCATLVATPDGQPFKYRNYYDSYFLALMDQLGMKYTPHFTRHTCASMMAEAHIDPTIQKKILGHSGAMTLTERVYTHLDVRVLVDSINQI